MTMRLFCLCQLPEQRFIVIDDIVISGAEPQLKQLVHIFDEYL